MNSVCSGLQLESVQRTRPTWLGIKVLLVSVGRVVVFALSSDVSHCIHVDKPERILLRGCPFRRLSREVGVNCACFFVSSFFSLLGRVINRPKIA